MQILTIAQLDKDFSVLFCENRGFEFGGGWARLVYDLATEISMEAQRESISQDSDSYPKIVQIKEKFGMLRVYMRNGTPKMFELIECAEKKSVEICERCGLPGELRGDGYLHVACDSCESRIVSGDRE